MAAYTKLNLKDVEDQAPNFGLSPGLEFRSARVPLECEEAGISYQRLAPNYRQPFGHNHKQQEEVYVLVAGRARVKLEDDIVELEPWDAVRIAKETMRNARRGRRAPSSSASVHRTRAPATRRSCPAGGPTSLTADGFRRIGGNL